MLNKKIFCKSRFNKVLIIPFKHFSQLHNINSYFNKILPYEWQILLISDGSFTQNLNSLSSRKIKIELISKPYHKREVILKDNNNNNLAFAKSLLTKNYEKNIKLPLDKPIGQYLIKFKIDIYKDIHEIYYGYFPYSYLIFNSNEPIWGRKYTIYYQNKPVVIIQEFFSPRLINFFN